VFLTLQHLDGERVRARFPTIAEMCSRAGIDIAGDLIPVGPAAHYMMGGIDTDEWGRTSVAGLFAAGETACTGVHGANRLASNSLLEGLVFGARAGEAMQQTLAAAVAKPDRVPAAVTGDAADPEPLDSDGIRDLMWRSAGVFRTRERLSAAVSRLARAYAAAQLDVAQRPHHSETRRRLNLATVSLLVARAALRREESRGGHFRADFPDRDDLHWKVHVVEAIA
jgi:L-aspartate oxidase